MPEKHYLKYRNKVSYCIVGNLKQKQNTLQSCSQRLENTSVRPLHQKKARGWLTRAWRLGALPAPRSAETTPWLGTSAGVGRRRSVLVAPGLLGKRRFPAPEAVGPYVPTKPPKQGLGVETVWVLAAS